VRPDFGPQKTSRAIGTMPRLAAAAVSRIGRMRWQVASTTVTLFFLPALYVGWYRIRPQKTGEGHAPGHAPAGTWSSPIRS
jgi:hypothetical protein